ncbi:transposase [Sphingomonas sp.]|uniref:transposase n=1 Tax=Sphingomonas sp. TaxID=28214 RepID=UPI0037509EE3
MARLARIVIPGIPHHVTQRGNGRQQTFFSADDYAAYRDLLAMHCATHGVAVWSWVLMPNHVHLIVVPEHGDALRGALSKVHRAYAGRIHAREQRTGHFWQGRFGCVAMDEPHLLAALRYVALNPVRARLTRRAEDWCWGSVHALLDPARGDGLTDTAPVLDRVPDFAALLRGGEDEALSQALRRTESVGRPLGASDFLDRVEAQLGRNPRPAKRGPRPMEN